MIDPHISGEPLEIVLDQADHRALRGIEKEKITECGQDKINLFDARGAAAEKVMLLPIDSLDQSQQVSTGELVALAFLDNRRKVIEDLGPQEIPALFRFQPLFRASLNTRKSQG